MCEACGAYRTSLNDIYGATDEDRLPDDAKDRLKDFIESKHGTVETARPLAMAYLTSMMGEDPEATKTVLNEILSEPWIAGNVIFHLGRTTLSVVRSVANHVGMDDRELWQLWLLEWEQSYQEEPGEGETE
jgi:hypothetical protein